MIKKDREVILKEDGQTYEGVIYMILGYDEKNNDMVCTVGGNEYWMETMDLNFPGSKNELEKIVLEELLPVCKKIGAVVDKCVNGSVHQ